MVLLAHGSKVRTVVSVLLWVKARSRVCVCVCVYAYSHGESCVREGNTVTWYEDGRSVF